MEAGTSLGALASGILTDCYPWPSRRPGEGRRGETRNGELCVFTDDRTEGRARAVDRSGSDAAPDRTQRWSL